MYNTLKTCKYCIEQIIAALDLKSENPRPSYRAAYKASKHLEKLIEIASIQEERMDFPIQERRHR